MRGTRGRLCVLEVLCNWKSLHIGITWLGCSRFIATLVWEVRSSPKPTQSRLQRTLRCVRTSGSHYTPRWTRYYKVFPSRSQCTRDILSDRIDWEYPNCHNNYRLKEFRIEEDGNRRSISSSILTFATRWTERQVLLPNETIFHGILRVVDI